MAWPRCGRGARAVQHHPRWAVTNKLQMDVFDSSSADRLSCAQRSVGAGALVPVGVGRFCGSWCPSRCAGPPQREPLPRTHMRSGISTVSATASGALEDVPVARFVASASLCEQLPLQLHALSHAFRSVGHIDDIPCFPKYRYKFNSGRGGGGQAGTAARSLQGAHVQLCGLGAHLCPTSTPEDLRYHSPPAVVASPYVNRPPVGVSRAVCLPLSLGVFMTVVQGTVKPRF